MTPTPAKQPPPSTTPTAAPEAEKLLIKLLGLSVYGDCRELWLKLSPDEQREVCRVACELKSAHYLYRQLPDALPPEFAKLFKQAWNGAAAKAMLEQAEYRKFCAEMEEARVRFAPLKGLVMRAKYYPDPALRISGDWDVLFHPDDYSAALNALQRNGWTSSTGIVDLPHQWHCGGLHRNDITLEPHYALPRIKGVSPHRIWAEFHPAVAGGCRCEGCPELNLVIAARHFSEGGYSAVPVSKFLLDAAYIINSPNFDWRKVRKLAQDWRLPYPGNMLAANTDFFPPEVIARMNADPERVAVFEKLFANLHHLRSLSPLQRKMVIDPPFSREWLRIRLNCVSPNAIRIKYRLPPAGHRLLLAKYTLADIAGKALMLLNFFASAKENRADDRELIAEAEKVETPTTTDTEG